MYFEEITYREVSESGCRVGSKNIHPAPTIMLRISDSRWNDPAQVSSAEAFLRSALSSMRTRRISKRSNLGPVQVKYGAKRQGTDFAVHVEFLEKG